VTKGRPRARVTPATEAAEERPHVPVLLAEVIAHLEPSGDAWYIDGTFGAGGYSAAILQTAHCSVLALDRDPEAVRAAAPLVARFAPSLKVIEAPFSAMVEVARRELPEGTAPAGIVLDLGLSSMQLDEARRGFSFQSDGPLDMRMGRAGPTAADFLNAAEETEIARVLFELGEEKKSRVIARAIVRARERRPIERTLELADIVSSVLGPQRAGGKHPATRTFQALRLHINKELEELEKALEAAEELLQPGGRLVVVTFHSLEDRIVKRFLRERSEVRGGGPSRHLPELQRQAPRFRIVNPRPVTPGEEEVKANPRARSAKLRVAERL
jgi:16S rRNA (cytosine1402-N4)-methyltransferase